MPSRLLLNHRTSALPAEARPGPAVHAFHQRLPGYVPTPLRDVPALATACGVGRVLVKDESSRLGLPAFKILGASWATYRVLCDRLGGEPDWTTLDDLAAIVAERLGPLRLVAATDGNHGRAVAHMARLLGLSATILVPDGTADARIDGIASEGAEVVEAPGTYDDAITLSAEMAGERDLVISDTSWPGYEDPPRWVIEGYATIFAEIDAALEAGLDRGVADGREASAGDREADVATDAAAVTVTDEGVAVPDPPVIDLAVVPLGVGALGAAAGASLRAGLEPGDGPVLVGVEPDSAACVAAAVEAGHLVEVPGPHRSLMAGLNCGLASMLALPTVTATFDAFVAIDDDRCRRAIRAHAEAGMDVGETGAAALAGLMAVVDEHRDALPIPATATVLLLATEGVTDPASFEQIVGRPPH
ncbi:MAG TPA: pyridoxal-phosphate dependent enzyme [Acidimicrobiales bacterium]|nr:pyridoxal-phosphate dependent enzyme [Acidimicrobiales bacterium]